MKGIENLGVRKPIAILKYGHNLKTTMPEEQILQLGAIAVLFAIAIREFFGYLKGKKSCNNSTYDKDIALIRQQLENHMTDYNKCLNRQENEIEKLRKDNEIIKASLIRIEAELRK